MIYGMYLSTMGGMCEMSRHDTIANNLANVNTDGFKPNFSICRSVPAESVIKGLGRRESDLILEKTGGGAWVDRTATDFTNGPVIPTDGPLNMAIYDKDPDRVSFFMVRRRGGAHDGEVHYTRNGMFQRDNDGQLVTTSGDLVLDAEGQPMTIPQSGTLKIGDDGVIRHTLDNIESVVVGRVGLASLPKLDAELYLKQMGDNCYVPEEGTDTEMDTVQITADIKSGMLEQSSTNPVYEMVNMIDSQRSFEMNMRFLSMQDQTLGQALSRLTPRS